MWSRLVECIESDIDIKHKLSHLHTLINVQDINLKEEKDIKLVKSKIREFCNEATQRAGGLLLLYAVVHSSSTLYIDNWSQLVLGSLKSPDALVAREIPLKVLNRMLLNFGQDQNYNAVFERVVPEIMTLLLKPENDRVYKLSCQSLAICMKCVPKFLANKMEEIEKLLLKELDNPYGEIVEATGECFAALPYCMFVWKNKKTDYKEIWCNQFYKLINTINHMLNNLTKLSEGEEGYIDVKEPKFNIPIEHLNDLPLSLVVIIKSLCQCMAKMMSSDNQGACIPISDLFTTLNGIIEVEEKIEKKNEDLSIAHIKLGYPQMLIGAYVVFEALILNSSIFEQGRYFVSLMNKSFKAIGNISFSQSSVSYVRGSAWKLINVWLSQFGSRGSQCLAGDKTILQEILADIDSGNKEIGSNRLESTAVEETNKKNNKIFVCTHALKVLKNLLETSGSSLPKYHLDEISSTLLRTSKDVTRQILKLKPSSVPYSDEKCRKLLFDVLLCCAIYSDPLHSKCIMEAQSIFNTAYSNDTSPKVRRVCHRFRKLSRYYLNPRKPPPDAVQYSHPSMLNRPQQPIIASIRSEWGNGIEWNGANGPSSDDQMDENEIAQDQGENAYSDKMESEGDLMTIEENDGYMNHAYSRKSSQSMGEEDSIDDSDIEPTYVSTDSNPQRINLNDSSRINSSGMQPCVEQYANEVRTERHASEEVVRNSRNSVKNDVEDHVSTFVEVKAAVQKSLAMGNGEWRKKGNVIKSDEDDSEMDEEGDEEGDLKEEADEEGDEEGDLKEEADEEGDANEEVSDNAADEASDGKRRRDFQQGRPRKRQKCTDDEDDDVEDEDIPVNNQSSDEEENEVNNLPAAEQNAGSNPENLIDEESQEENEDNGCRSPTIREMCGDFVLVEPATVEIS